MANSDPWEREDKQIQPTPPREGKVDYEMEHRPSQTSPVYDLTEGGIIPKDIYTHPQYYADMTQQTYKESFSVILNIKDKPEGIVTIYRASPKKELNTGDWVTLSKSYAKQESLSEGTPVHSYRVKAKDVFFAGDDINEFGYFGKPIAEKPEYVISILEKDLAYVMKEGAIPSNANMTDFK
jgi:hypothetical protein